MAPIFAFILAYLLLKEAISRYDLVMMLLTLTGILCVVLGGNNEEKKEVEDSAVPILVLYILLFSNPILTGGGQVAMRSMGKVNDAVIAWYLQISVLIFSAIIMLIFGQSFTIYS